MKVSMKLLEVQGTGSQHFPHVKTELVHPTNTTSYSKAYLVSMYGIHALLEPFSDAVEQ